MDSFFIRGMYRGVKVFSFGKFFRNPALLDGWGFSAFLEMSDERIEEDIFDISDLGNVGGIFKLRSKSGLMYDSHESVVKFHFPPVSDWTDKRLSDCLAIPRFLGKDHEIFSQRCFCLSLEGFDVWLPKLELAGRMFFHYDTLINSAFEPSGLDFNFCMVDGGCDSVDIYSISKIGVAPWVFEEKSYRDHLGWLLTNRDVRLSFESIWRCLNQEQVLFSDGCYEWDFNFLPPNSLGGVEVTAMGSASSDKKHFLIWEIVKLEIPIENNKSLVFHHPDLRNPSGVKRFSSNSLPSHSLPVDSIRFDGGMVTRVAYENESVF